MTFQEFQDKSLDCAECPIAKAEFCSYAQCIEFNSDPPCSFVDPNQDMGDWIKEKREQIERIEAREQERVLKQKAKDEAARKRAETTRQMKSYCHNEIQSVKFYEELVKATESDIKTAECMVFAFNTTNEMFGYSQRKEVAPYLFRVLEEAKQKLVLAQEAYESKRKEFYSKRRNNKDGR